MAANKTPYEKQRHPTKAEIAFLRNAAFDLSMRGFSSAEIAEKLEIHPQTAWEYVQHKLNEHKEDFKKESRTSYDQAVARYNFIIKTAQEYLDDSDPVVADKAMQTIMKAQQRLDKLGAHEDNRIKIEIPDGLPFVPLKTDESDR